MVLDMIFIPREYWVSGLTTMPPDSWLALTLLALVILPLTLVLLTLSALVLFAGLALLLLAVSGIISALLFATAVLLIGHDVASLEG